MKMIYETPQMNYELLATDDVMTTSAFSPAITRDKENTYLAANDFSMTGVISD